MIYRLLADLILITHFAFILFAIFGGLLVLWKFRIILLHLPALLGGAFIISTGGICPLTPLENHLRELAGQAAYSGSFLEHYLLMVIYPPGLTRPIQIALAAGLIILNVIIYILVFARRKR